MPPPIIAAIAAHDEALKKCQKGSLSSARAHSTAVRSDQPGEYEDAEHEEDHHLEREQDQCSRPTNGGRKERGPARHARGLPRFGSDVAGLAA
jgi:hypothetical protein